MNPLEQSAFLKALGWALLNGLWQFGLLWLVFLFILLTRRNLKPGIKHGLSLIFLLAGCLEFVLGFSYQYAAYLQGSSPETTGIVLNFTSHPFLYDAVKNWIEKNLPYLSVL